jgi:predicted NBD/HSP70 family sugar kinase
VFEATSRYSKLEQIMITTVDPDGAARTVTCVRRRFLPGTAGQTTLVEHLVVDGERLDNLAARYLGDPTQFWRVCDANEVFRPDELTETPGRTIDIALPGL